MLFFFLLVEPFEEVVEADEAWMMYGVGLLITGGLKQNRQVKSSFRTVPNVCLMIFR